MTITAIALLVTLTGGGPQQAELPARPRAEIRMVSATGPDGPGRLDADGDGVVTREEFSAPMGSAFDRLDADRDGRLSTEELAAGPGPGSGVHIIRRDGGPGGPGGPGPLVFPGGAEGGPRILTFRTGPDGGLRPDGPGEGRVFVRRFGGPDGPMDVDKDGDGKVSQEEFLAPLREAFAGMDADHDGFLDEAENAPPPPPSPPSGD